MLTRHMEAHRPSGIFRSRERSSSGRVTCLPQPRMPLGRGARASHTTTGAKRTRRHTYLPFTAHSSSPFAVCGTCLFVVYVHILSHAWVCTRVFWYARVSFGVHVCLGRVPGGVFGDHHISTNKRAGTQRGSGTTQGRGRGLQYCSW
jgi:hypothetical protein